MRFLGRNLARTDFWRSGRNCGSPAAPETRYSPGEVIETETVMVTGNPDPIL
jgi:hypothetical protein